MKGNRRLVYGKTIFPLGELLEVRCNCTRL